MYISIDLLHRNPLNPRKNISEQIPEDDNGKKLYQTIEGLAASISEVGLINPIIVEKFASGYQIIAGERRFEACKLLGMSEVRCEVIESTEQTKLLVMAIENLQRKDLTIVEEGEIYEHVHGVNSDYRSMSKLLGVPISRISYAINAYKKLSPQVQQMVQSKTITEESTRALTKLYNKPELQLAVAQRLAKEDTKQFDKAKEIIEFVNDKKTPEHVVNRLISDDNYSIDEAKDDARFDIYDPEEESPIDKTYTQFVETLEKLDTIITPTNIASFRAIDKIGMKEMLQRHIQLLQQVLTQIDYI